MPKWPKARQMTPARIQDYLERARALRERLEAGRLDKTGPNSRAGILERIQHYEAVAAFYAARYIQLAISRTPRTRIRQTTRAMANVDVDIRPRRNYRPPSVDRPTKAQLRKQETGYPDTVRPLRELENLLPDLDALDV